LHARRQETAGRLTWVTIACSAALVLSSATLVSAESQPHQASVTESGVGAEFSEEGFDQEDQLEVAHYLEDHFGDHAGWGEAVLERDLTTVTLRWAGGVPDELREFASKPVNGIQVKILPAVYGEKELLAEMDSLIDRAEKAGFVPVEVAPADDWSGIEVIVTPSVGTQRALSLTGNIPITVGVRDEAPVFLADRQNDAEPFWAGGVIARGGTPWCSAGFTAIRGGERMMLTARHCGTNRGWTTPTGTYVGMSGGGKARVDAMMIRGRSYAPVSFVCTARNCSTGRTVRGANNPLVGERVCASGGFTGQVCAWVRDRGVIKNGIGPGFILGRDDRTAIAGNGDSGGPVYRVRGDGGLGVRGMIDQGIPGTETTCKGFVLPNRFCYWEIFAVGQAHIRNALNVTWATG
jgi:hypothetical protein